MRRGFVEVRRGFVGRCETWLCIGEAWPGRGETWLCRGEACLQ